MKTGPGEPWGKKGGKGRKKKIDGRTMRSLEVLKRGTTLGEPGQRVLRPDLKQKGKGMRGGKEKGPTKKERVIKFSKGI